MNAIVAMNFPSLQRLVAICSAVVIIAGVGRELFVAFIGDGTILNTLRHFTLDAENTVGAWYSSALMLANAGLIALIAIAEAKRREPMVLQWRLLALIFVALSIDETASFHESTIGPLQKAFGFSGFLSFAWVVPAIFLLALFAVIYVPFLTRLPRRHALGFVAAGLIFVAGALGMEMIGGVFNETLGGGSAIYIITTTIEESLEVIGLTVLFFVLTNYLAGEYGPLALGTVAADA